jgi:VWFA-related protein
MQRRCVQVLITLFLPALAAAQSAKPAPTTIQVTSRIVYVDVIVRDSAGHIVHGLTQKDFRVLENRKPQHIAYFADHTRDIQDTSQQAAPSPGKLRFSNISPVSNSVNIILFDFFNTAPQDMVYARKQMIKFLEALPPGRQTALFVLGTHLQMIQSFTASTDRLIAAAKAMKLQTSLVETTGEAQQEDDLSAAFSAAVGQVASHTRNAVADQIYLAHGQDEIRASAVTQTALKQIAAAVSGYPGRKNLYWLADEFPLYGGPMLELHEASQRMITGNMSTADMADANRAQADAQIAIYPISLIGMDASGMGAEADGSTSTRELFTARVSMHEMLNNMADTTGGEAYYSTNNIAGALTRAFQDGSSYYSLAYRPSDENWNGHFRKIKVKLDHHGDWLSYRRGYYATPNQPVLAATPDQEMKVALQPDTPNLTMIRLRAKVELPDAQHPNLRLDSVIAPATVSFSTGAHGRHHAHLLVTLIAVPDAALHRQVKLNPVQTSGIYAVNLDSAAFQKLMLSGMPMHQALRLAPGSYHLRLGVVDLANGRLGTLDMPVTIPASVASR